MVAITLTNSQRSRLHRPILIEGLPGIGNVGKIAADILVEQTKAKRLVAARVDAKPGLVLVQQNGLVKFPELALYHARVKQQDFLFLVGDGQPSSDAATHELAESLVRLVESLDGRAIVTLGGIGLHELPERPSVYVTGTDRVLIASFKKLGANPRVHGVVGPVLGFTGVALGLAKGRVPAVALLGETLAHPFAIGLQGAEQLLRLFSKAYGFAIDLETLRESIDALEAAMRGQPAGDLPKTRDETSYIG